MRSSGRAGPRAAPGSGAGPTPTRARSTSPRRTRSTSRRSRPPGPSVDQAALGRLDDGLRRAPDANVANGMALGSRAAWWSASSRTARMPVVDRARAEAHGARPAALNSPNDVVVKGDGTVWFTDPSYGYLQGFRPRAAGRATTSTATTPHRATSRWSPTTFTSRTGSRSRPTSACSTSPTAARTRSRTASTTSARTTSWPSTSSTAASSPTVECSP